MPFCASCGKQIKLGEKFCGYCGVPIREVKAAIVDPVATVTPAATFVPQTPGTTSTSLSPNDAAAETVVGVIPHLVQSAGGLKSRDHFLVATNQRFLIARFSPAMMQEALAVSKANAKGFGKLLAGRVLLMGDIVEYSKRYFKMSPSQILDETPGNMALKLSDIHRAYIDYEQEDKDEDSHIRMDKYILTIESDSAGDFKYVFDADPQDMKVLRDALGDRAHGEGRTKAMKPTY